MLSTALLTLGQIVSTKFQSDTPRIEAASNAMMYIILAVLIVGALLLVFKTAKRNNMMDEQ